MIDELCVVDPTAADMPFSTLVARRNDIEGKAITITEIWVFVKQYNKSCCSRILDLTLLTASRRKGVLSSQAASVMSSSQSTN